MVVNIEQVQRGVTAFVENEIAKKATGFRKFGIYFIIPMLNKYIAEYLEKFRHTVPDMFDENGNVKLDEVYNNAKLAIQKSGQFELMGIIFNETDIDRLFAYIKQTGTSGVSV